MAVWSIPDPPGDLLQAKVPHLAVLGDGHRGCLALGCYHWWLPVGCEGDWVDDTGGAGRGRGSLDSGSKWKEQEALGNVGDPM